MGGRRYGYATAAVCALALAVILALGRCTGPDADPHAVEQAAQQLFDRQAAAVLAGDTARYLADVDPRADRFRERQRLVAINLARLPVAAWTYRVRKVELHGDRAEAHVELRYRLTDRARAPVHAAERFALRRRDGRWYVAGETAGSSRQLWEQGPVRAVRGRHSLVLGTVDRSVLRRIADRADRAVPAVSASWPEPWARRTVVLVPSSVQDMAELLDGDAATYQGIAAVTTGPRGGEKGKWKRIVVNRQAYALLSDRGRQVVLTHETVHVATRAHTRAATPLWLSEGLADWIAYRGTGADPVTAAPTLAAEIREGGEPPRRLPPDHRFGFTGDPDALASAYEGSWLACRLIATRWGADRLAELYVAVGQAQLPQTAAVDRALRDVLGTDRAEFTRMWRSTLQEQLG